MSHTHYLRLFLSFAGELNNSAVTVNIKSHFSNKALYCFVSIINRNNSQVADDRCYLKPPSHQFRFLTHRCLHLGCDRMNTTLKGIPRIQ